MGETIVLGIMAVAWVPALVWVPAIFLVARYMATLDGQSPVAIVASREDRAVRGRK